MLQLLRLERWEHRTKSRGLLLGWKGAVGLQPNLVGLVTWPGGQRRPPGEDTLGIQSFVHLPTIQNEVCSCEHTKHNVNRAAVTITPCVSFPT